MAWPQRNNRKEEDHERRHLKGNWKQFKGKMIEQWGKLTNDDFDVIDGKREQFLGKLQERQGIARDAAEKQLKEWQERHPDFRFND